MHSPSTATLDPLLRYLWQYGATDLHLSAGGTPRVRIDGKLLGVSDAPVSTVEFLDTILAYSERLHALVTNLLEMSRIQADAVNLTLRSTSIEPGVVTVWRPTVTDDSVHCAPGTPGVSMPTCCDTEACD